MTEYEGCTYCIYNEDQFWELTFDFTQVCHHTPNPENIFDIREGVCDCEFREINY